jgi:hypothetical protein
MGTKFTQKHLVSIADLSADEIWAIITPIRWTSALTRTIYCAAQ